MSTLFEQLTFLRYVTLSTVKDFTEKEVVIIPKGFNNHILWNLGHIYVSQEQFAFTFAREQIEVPEGFTELFAMGTKPADWTVKPPELSKIVEMLKEQPARISKKLVNRLDEEVAKPFVLPGLSLNTIGELLTFNLYHEGIHVQAIRMLKKLIDTYHEC